MPISDPPQRRRQAQNPTEATKCASIPLDAQIVTPGSGQRPKIKNSKKKRRFALTAASGRRARGRLQAPRPPPCCQGVPQSGRRTVELPARSTLSSVRWYPARAVSGSPVVQFPRPRAGWCFRVCMPSGHRYRHCQYLRQWSRHGSARYGGPGAVAVLPNEIGIVIPGLGGGKGERCRRVERE